MTNATRDPSTSTTKECPYCAETIRGRAIVCRFCGYDYRAGTIPGRAGATSALAVAALVLGILAVGSMVVAGLFFPLGAALGGGAVLSGVQARGQVDRSGGRLEGRGMATAGLVLGAVALGVGLLVWAFVFSWGSAVSVELDPVPAIPLSPR